MHVTSSNVPESAGTHNQSKILEDRTGRSSTISTSKAATPIYTSPFTPVQSTLLEILQREQDNALSLLESNPFLSYLFSAYQSQHSAASSITQSPQTLNTESTNPQAPYLSLQTECDSLRIQLAQAQASVALEIQNANRDARRHFTEQTRLKTELDSVKAAYTELKEDYTNKLAASDTLTTAFAKLQVEHARALSDKEARRREVEKLRATQLEQNTRYDILNRSHTELAVEYNNHKKNAENELEVALADTSAWKVKHDSLNQMYAEIRDLYTDHEEPYGSNNLDDNETLVEKILETHDALQKCFTEVQDFVTRTDQENSKLRSERDDAQHELTIKMKQHVEDLRELRCNMSEVVRLYDNQTTRCEKLESEKRRLEQNLDNVQHGRSYVAVLKMMQDTPSILNRNEP